MTLACLRPSGALELLAPAKNADYGIAAIDHGADAVYIGGPAFGARAAASNGIDDIARLCDYAHRYAARVHVALNTLIADAELEAAQRLIWQVYEAGADALIVQDMGLLELDLPPIQLHASTQCDIRTPAIARFLQDVGFSQLVLARELTLAEIEAIARLTEATLEFFVHGALCVSYSGQCSISHALTGRSANRGECAQICRLPMTLADAQGGIIAARKHLLSLKDNDQSENLGALIDAGIRSFKIEGRLKDLAYVKNVTAWYRQQLDAAIACREGFRPAAQGRIQWHFTPQPEKTFNRGATDYFLHGRQHDIAAFDTPKFAGEPVGKVLRLAEDWFEIDGHAPLHNGDGLSFFTAGGELAGLRVNRVHGRRIYPATRPAALSVGTVLLRNRDQSFVHSLAGKSAERLLAVDLRFELTPDGVALTLTDESGIAVTAGLTLAIEPARDAARMRATLGEQLGKLGNTMFRARTLTLVPDPPPFLTLAQINALRRAAVEQLIAARLQAWQRPPRAQPVSPPARYPATRLDFLANVLNEKARAFYRRHGVEVVARAFEAGEERGAVSLMITRHCLRFSFHLCPKQVKGLKPEPMALVIGDEKLSLRFDCRRCEMHVVGRLRQGRPLMLRAAGSRGEGWSEFPEGGGNSSGVSPTGH